ncbi:MAG: 50S ribosomal protein L9 [Patescibacteria group bacterium]
MKVVLLQEVKGLGKTGAVKDVRNGYGFNFLLPEGLAELATEGALKRVERIIAKRAKGMETAIMDAKAQAALLDGKKVSIKTKAEDGKLFGSIGREEIAAALSAMQIELAADAIAVKKPFKKTGTFPVEADFGNDVKATFQVSIEAE